MLRGAAWTFLTINGIELAPTYDVDAAEDLVLAVATGAQDSLDRIAEAFGRFVVGG